MSDAVAVPVAPAASAPTLTTIAAPTAPEKPATAPAEAAPATTGDAAAKPAEAAATDAEKAPEEKPKEVEPKEFLALKREKAKLFEESRAIKQAQKAFAQEKQQVEQAMQNIVAPVKQVIEKFDDSPFGLVEFAAKASGKTTQEVFDAILLAATKLGDAPDPNDRVTKLERQLAEKEAAEQAKRNAEEARLAEQAEQQMRADMAQRLGQFFATESERYEHILLRGEKAHNDLMDLAEAWHNEHGEPLGVVQAADLLESQYLAEDEELLTNRLLKSRKLSKHFTPTAAPAAPVEAAPAVSAHPTNAAPAPQPAAGDPTNEPSSPRLITARRAIVPAGSKVVRKAQSDAELIERLGKQVRFT